MSLLTGVGVSTERDLKTAIAEAANKAREHCAEPSAVLAFVTFNHPAEELEGAAGVLADAFPSAATGGGQVNGITFDAERYDALHANRHAVAVVCFGGKGVDVALSLRAVGSSPDGRDLGRKLAEDALGKLRGPAVGGLLFGQGGALLPPVDQQLVNGVRDVAPRLRLTGSGFSGGATTEGMAIPGRAFLGRTVSDQSALMVVFGGDLRLGFSAANGMKPVGTGAFVTRVEGLEVIEMDNRPAKDVVLELLAGDDAQARALFEKNPMVMSVERGITLAAPDIEGDFYWCHGPLSFTPRGGFIDAFFPRKGMGLAVTRIDPESCMAAVSEAGSMLTEDAGGSSFEFTIAFSCSLRGLTLGADVAREDLEFRTHVQTRRHLGIVANCEIGSYRHGRPAFTGWVYALMGALAE